MKKQLSTEYVFIEKEIKLIKDCVDYTCHRLLAHGKPKNINLDAVLKLKEELLDGKHPE